MCKLVVATHMYFIIQFHRITSQACGHTYFEELASNVSDSGSLITPSMVVNGSRDSTAGTFLAFVPSKHLCQFIIMIQLGRIRFPLTGVADNLMVVEMVDITTIYRALLLGPGGLVVLSVLLCRGLTRLPESRGARRAGNLIRSGNSRVGDGAAFVQTRTIWVSVGK
jgi:hypothetical protein